MLHSVVQILRNGILANNLLNLALIRRIKRIGIQHRNSRLVLRLLLTLLLLLRKQHIPKPLRVISRLRKLGVLSAHRLTHARIAQDM
jgi:hypothetical protein